MLRSTREIQGNAEEVYHDLLLGDVESIPIQGRRRWEKRFSHEEVLVSYPEVSNQEDIPFVSTVLHKKKTKKEEIAEGSSIVLKEWRKLKISSLSTSSSTSILLMLSSLLSSFYASSWSSYSSSFS